jgi:hypothetical protein
MSFIRLLHALSTGAATFSLSQVLPKVPIAPKTIQESFEEDGRKLHGDFRSAYQKLTVEVDQRGASVTTKA